MIRTARLLLIPATVASLQAEAARDLPRFASLLGVATPEVWPPDLYDDDAVAWTLRAFAEGRECAPWLTYYFARKAPTPELVGAGGFMGAPDAAATVEIGYSILAAHRRQGYASEAAAALVARAFNESSVRSVIAHTYPDLLGSIGVLRKNGFRPDGEGAEVGTVRFARERNWRERLRWPTLRV